jgi:K+/H+ antiporter YhaU regulatory subunit KhtT
MTDVGVGALRLPGIGWRYTLSTDDGRQLLVVVEDRGPRHLVLVDGRLAEPVAAVRLDGDLAAVLAALLTGARFYLVADDEVEAAHRVDDRREVVVSTLQVDEGSPVVGRVGGDVIPRGLDVTLLGVICDATPELVETHEDRGIHVGDRLVVAGRRAGLQALQTLT